MGRLKKLVTLLGILAMGLAAELAPHAGATGLDSSPHAARREFICPDLGVELLANWGDPHEEAAPGESPSAGKPLRYDCGIGETWRRHVP